MLCAGVSEVALDMGTSSPLVSLNLEWEESSAERVEDLESVFFTEE